MSFKCRYSFIVSVCRRYDHVTPVLRRLGWITMKDRITLRILKFVFIALRSGTPLYLRDCLSLRHVGRILRSTDKFRLEPLIARCRIGEGSFRVAGPSLWNDLPV